MSTDLTAVTVRFEKAAESLKLQISEVPTLKESLSEHGIEENEDGLRYLNSRVISQEDLIEILTKSFDGKGKFCIKAAAMYLKGIDPFEEEIPQVVKPEIPVSGESTSATIIEFIQANKPIGQMTDVELLTMWDKNRDDNLEAELSRRARGQSFIVLKPGRHLPGKEKIDIEYHWSFLNPLGNALTLRLSHMKEIPLLLCIRSQNSMLMIGSLNCVPSVVKYCGKGTVLPAIQISWESEMTNGRMLI